MTRDEYQAYLRSPEWQSLRERVIHREHGACQGCRLEPGSEVHHVTYDRVGRELLLDLVLLCPKCHGAMHGAADVVVPRWHRAIRDEDAYLRACEERARFGAAPVVMAPLDAPQLVSADDEDAYLRGCEARAKARRAAE